MPDSPGQNLEKIEDVALGRIRAWADPLDLRTAIEPIAFGLRALKIIFVMDEAKGSTEPLEQDLAAIHGVQSVDVVDVRRAIG